MERKAGCWGSLAVRASLVHCRRLQITLKLKLQLGHAEMLFRNFPGFQHAGAEKRRAVRTLGMQTDYMMPPSPDDTT